MGLRTLMGLHLLYVLANFRFSLFLLTWPVPDDVETSQLGHIGPRAPGDRV
jgi:hypothetical protein